jgi:COMPASS component SWD3
MLEPIDKVNDECFTIKFHKSDSMIAAGYSSGRIGIFSVDGKQPNKVIPASQYPITCIRWKPNIEDKDKSILVSVSAEGIISQFHVKSGRELIKIQEQSPIMCIDYTKEGNVFATGSNDMKVRLYDDNTKCCITEMKPSGFDNPGHSNRIFSLNFHKEIQNLLTSGGWDNTIQFYDVRAGTIVNSLYGPHLCGDSLDTKGDYMLTGSWSLEDQIQIWDIRTLKLVETVSWGEINGSTYIYGAQFNKRDKNNIIAAGGSNYNSLVLFDNSTQKRSPLANIKSMKKACYSVDFSFNGNMIAYAGADGYVKVLNINN